MEESRKNIDELFTKAKNAKVDFSIDRVAAVVGLTTAAGAAVAAGSSSIFKLSTMWITVGSIATVVSTIALLNTASPSDTGEHQSAGSHSTTWSAPIKNENVLEESIPMIEIPTLQRNEVEKIGPVFPTQIDVDSNDNLVMDIQPQKVVLVEEMKTSIDKGAFESISLNASIHVRLDLASKSSIGYEGDEAIYKMLSFDVSGGVLSIGVKKEFERQFSRLSNANHFELVLKMPSLQMISINGSGSVTSDDQIESKELTIYVNGSGDVSITKILPKSLSISVNGSGDVNIYSVGTIERGNITVNGSGDVCTKTVSINDLEVSVIGSGDAMVRAEQHLTVSITGSGDVCYSGAADVNTTIVGSGDINHCE